MKTESALAAIDGVQRAIEKADVETLAKAIRLIDAARRYARARKWKGVADKADFWAVTARREMGRLLKEMPKNPGAKGLPGGGTRGSKKEPRVDAPPTLADLGITKREAHQYQKLAEVTPAAWVTFEDDAKAGRIEASVAGAMRYRPKPAVEVPDPPAGKYRCVVIDPPWPMGRSERIEWPSKGSELDYKTMSIEEIAALPIRELLDTDTGSQVYLWVTHRFLPDGLDLFKTWGVTYHCILTWIKPEGMVPFSWMFNTEHVLFGYAGPMAVQRKGLRVAFEAPRPQPHSSKPDIFYDRVREASYSPRLEMFARAAHAEFEPWGAEVKK